MTYVHAQQLEMLSNIHLKLLWSRYEKSERASDWYS